MGRPRGRPTATLMTPPPQLPRNFLEEVESALEETRTTLEAQHGRLAALEELHTIARSLSFELGRPVTVFDVVRIADTSRERARRQRLLSIMRGASCLHPDEDGSGEARRGAL